MHFDVLYSGLATGIGLLAERGRSGRGETANLSIFRQTQASELLRRSPIRRAELP